MLKVGITGGIGSGKTTACQIFAQLGVPIYYADDRAKWLMSNDAQLVAAIKAAFGKKAYDQTGALNRSYLSGIIFSDPERRTELNGLVHPAVWRDGERWQILHQEAPYTLKEAALIFESGSHSQLDKIIVVTAPKEVRLARVIQRDQVEKEDVLARMAAQMPEAEKVDRADYVLYNDGERLLVPQIWDVHQQLLIEAKRNNIG